MPLFLISAVLSIVNSLSFASATSSETPFEIKDSRTDKDDSPHIILALASEISLSGSI